MGHLESLGAKYTEAEKQFPNYSREFCPAPAPWAHQHTSTKTTKAAAMTFLVVVASECDIADEAPPPPAAAPPKKPYQSLENELAAD